MRTFRTPTSASTDREKNCQNENGSAAYENEFLASLSEIIPTAGFTRTEESIQFLKSFSRRKDALVQRLLKMFNEHVFTNRVSLFDFGIFKFFTFCFSF